MPEYVFPLGGISVCGGKFPVMSPRVSPLTNMTLELRPHQTTEVFKDARQSLEHWVSSDYYPSVDVIVHSGAGGESEDARKHAKHAREYWICLQLVSPSSCFLKVWYEAGSNAWWTFLQSPGYNPDEAWEINPSDLVKAGEVWSGLQEHRRDAPNDSHLLRALPWLYRAVATPASDLRLRALLFAIGLETTLSPDSYKARNKHRKSLKLADMTALFARRLSHLASHLNMSPPQGWSFEDAAKHIYNLRSTLVHGDNIRTDWKGSTNWPSEEREAIATDLYKWMYEAARQGWTAAICDRNSIHRLQKGRDVAAAYWE